MGRLKFDTSGPDSNCGATLRRSLRLLAARTATRTGWTVMGIESHVRRCHNSDTPPLPTRVSLL